MSRSDSISALEFPSLPERGGSVAPKVRFPSAAVGTTPHGYHDKPVRKTPKGPFAKFLIISIAAHVAIGVAFAGWKLTQPDTPHEFVAVALPPPPVREIRVKLEQRSLIKPAPVKVNVVTSTAPPKVEFTLPEIPPIPPPPPELKFRGEVTALNFPTENPGLPAAPDSTPVLPAQIGAEGSAGYLGSPRLDYPAAARRLGLEGRCVLQLTIGADGVLRDLVVIVSSGHKLLDEAAQRCARACRYYPAQIGTEKVQSVVEWPFVFKLTQ